MPAGFAETPEPPYYAVIFTSTQTEDRRGYEAMAEAMMDLAHRQPGCLGAESARGADGLGITVSYFRDEEAVHAWKQHARHLTAQKMGKERWYAHYELRVAKVERAYSGPEGR
ncbi:antibiotic biosynthesis monooxygenase [Thalassobaculum sp. OXR-137]|uniref:antibiotic biosynthesis monooxygenase family protein n=1 Tax=Thalassobaculum sp. OXR-137 TaxID=3100173 RepID=UPI002AC95436|nr:antibiotic biosynthesis monooxygenase [Thalassobaculum sp. OXR-137]WPZ34729.1 antibiotic biosynthesis monooxygenase [Thalassobaculum sp. OXR-137]